MNDKIKEIVKEIECYRNEELCLIFLSRKESNALLDYISNLENYKSRCEKAVEFIYHTQNYGRTEHLKPYVNADDLLNILQKGENNE